MSTYPAERAPSAAGQSVNAGADNEITQDRFRGECFARVSIEPAVHLVPVGIGDAGNTGPRPWQWVGPGRAKLR